MKKISPANYQDLIKFIAIILMFFDHIGYYFDGDLLMFRVLGRPVMGIFCFLAGYNYKLLPNFNIASLGLLMLISSYAMLAMPVIDNILLPIFLGQCYISFFYKQLKNFRCSYMHFVILAFFAPFIWEHMWYGTYVIAIMVLGYNAKHDKNNYQIYWLLTLLLSSLYGIVVFDFLAVNISNFGFNVYLLALLALNLIIYCLVAYKKLAEPISVDFRPISRNALYIYFFSVTIMQFIWFYSIIKSNVNFNLTKIELSYILAQTTDILS